MKRHISIISIFLFVFVFGLTAQIRPVIISEVFYDTALEEDATIRGATNNGEFIELFNPTADVIDISGWRIQNHRLRFTFGNTRLLPKEAILVAFRHPTTPNFDLRTLFPTIPDNTQIIYQSSMFLFNNGDRIRLIDNNDQTVDEMSYRRKKYNQQAHSAIWGYWDIRARNNRSSRSLRSIQRKDISLSSSEILPHVHDYFVGTPTPGIVGANLLAQTVESILFSPGEINTNLPVGTLPGSAAVSPTGAATYTIPIEVPPGTNGFQPNLSIVYNSQGGHGALGMGWDIGGLSSISRGTQNLFFDGATSNTIQFNADDRLYLDGQRLILLNNIAHLQAGAVYGTEVENYARVRILNSAETGEIYFELTTKEGNVIEYGRTADALLANRNNITNFWGVILGIRTTIMSWRVNRMIDVHGNEINFTYQDNGQYLKSVIYANNQISFNYSNNTHSPQRRRVNGFWIRQNKLLNEIQVFSDGVLQKGYTFFYNNNANSVYARLNTVQPFYGVGNNRRFLNNTRIEWGSRGAIQEIDLGEMMYDSKMNDHDHSTFFMGDINGDGIPDFIHVLRDDQGRDTVTTIIRGATNSLPPKLTFPSTSNAMFVVGDTNNDGRAEIIRVGLCGVLVYSYDTTNGNWGTPRSLTYAGRIACLGGSGPYYRFVPFLIDVNNDGHVDLVVIPYIIRNSNSPADTWYYAQVFYGTSQGLSSTAKGYMLSSFDRRGNFITPIAGDFTGDGRLDILQLTFNLHLANANRFPTATNFVNVIQTDRWSTNIIAGTAVNSRRFDNAFPIDINNNGLTDILFKLDGNHGNHSNKWALKRNNGGASVTPITEYPYSRIIHGFSRNADNKNERDFAVVIDYDGDGYPDLIIADDIYSGTTFVRSDWHFYRNIGGNLQHERTIPRDEPVSKMNPVVMDINGDGVPDLVFGQGQGFSQYKAFTMPRANQHNVVRSITNGLGHVDRFEYTYFSDYNHSENRQNLRDLKAPIMVVGSHTMADGSTTSYTYERPKIHTRGRGFLGFEKITAHNDFSNQRVVSEYEINTTFFTTNLRRQTVSIGNTVASVTENTHTTRDAASGTGNIRRFIPTVTEQVSTDHIRNVITRSRNNFDNQGVLTRTETTVSDKRMGTVATSITEYSDFVRRTNTNSCLVAYLPQRVRTINRRARHNDYVFTTAYTYNDKGSIIKTVSRQGTSAETRTEYTYTQHGNLASVAVTPKGMPTRTTSYEYDALFRFVTTRTNTLGQQSRTTHNNWGRVLSETGIDGLTTRYEYDVFGRLVKTILPTGEEISRSVGIISANANNPTHRFGRTISSNKISGETVIHYDRLWREVYRETPGWNGARLRSFITYCPTTGNVVNTTQWCSAGNIMFEVSYEYNDFLQRITKRTVNDGNNTLVTRYAYDDVARTVTTTMPDGQTRISLTNALGEITGRIDPGGHISYEHDALGNPVRIAANNVLTEIEYDEVGRQIALHDPSAGTTTFEYFADGQLKRQTNANGAITEYTYDAAGRLHTKTVYPNEWRISGTQTTYSYVESGNGIGQIRSISKNAITIRQMHEETDRLIHRQTFTYNINHLVSSIMDEYDGRRFSFFYTYDNLWRPLTVTSPSGLTTTNEYNAFGDLVKIKRGNTIIWEGTAQNSKGQFTEFRLGNGLTTNHTHNSRGELTEIRTGAVNRTPIQHNTYRYDNKTGSLLERNDLIKERRETFLYDRVDRLIRADLNGVLQFEMRYSPNGNITYKTDVGNYRYEIDGRPFAMSGISNAGAGISSDKQFIDYTPFNKISRVAQGESRNNITAEYRIFYGLDRQRIKTEFFENDTLRLTRYYIGTYELDIRNGVETGTDYIFSPTGLVAMYRTFSIRATMPDDIDLTLPPTEIFPEFPLPGRPILIGGLSETVPTLNEVSTMSGSNGNSIIGNIPPPIINHNTIGVLYYIHLDRQGSIERITNHNGNLVSAYVYCAWGSRKLIYGREFTDRGYTGHEHLTALGLINMNGRVYDPVLARFLSPDPFVQAPDFTQSFNRYAYVFNNPFKYIDPSGEIAWLVPVAIAVGKAALKGAAISAGMYTIGVAFSYGGFDNWDWGQFGKSVGIGAISGAAGAGTGLLFQGWAAVPGIMPGAIRQGVVEGIGGAIGGGFGNVIMEGSWSAFGEGAARGFATGFIIGGASGGIQGNKLARDGGLNRWWGNEVQYGNTQWSIFNRERPFATVEWPDMPRINSRYNNDCVPVYITQGNNFFGGDMSLEEAKIMSGYQRNVGVRGTAGEIRTLVTDNFITGDFHSNSLADPVVMQQIQQSGNLLTVHRPTGTLQNGLPEWHLDHIRSARFFHSGRVEIRDGRGRFSFSSVNDNWQFFRLTGIRR